MTTNDSAILPDDADADDAPPLPPRRPSPWKYFLAAIVLCLLLAIFTRYVLLFATLAVVLLCVGALLGFAYWLFLGRRGIVRRLLRHRRMEARRRERWLRNRPRE